MALPLLIPPRQKDLPIEPSKEFEATPGLHVAVSLALAPGGADEHNSARDDESPARNHCQAKPRLHDGEGHSRHGPGLDVHEPEEDAR